ncbi:MAG: glycosyltransferase [bacterium]|nr:glycosyltransferase [bacterium]
MKILIMSVRAGYGHHSTGKAIIEYLKNAGHECEMLDIFDYINPILGNSIQDGYLLSTKYLSSYYGRIYGKLTEKDEPYAKHSITALLSNVVSKKLRQYVYEFGPDAIIGTHSYAGVVMTILKKNKVISCPTLGIVTDFTVHPFWESTDLDRYIIPDELLSWQMQKKGIDKAKLLPTGIPIRSQFSSKLDKKEARKQLGIADKKTILLMMGSMGYGDVADAVKTLDSFDADFQVLCVCGSNEKLKAVLENSKYKKDVCIYGFVDNVDVMMDASDLIISKPGGLTTSEAFAKELPMITMNPLPGQEDRNTDFLVNCGAVVAVNDRVHLDEALNQIFNCRWRLEHMRESVLHIGKPNATRDLCEFIINRCAVRKKTRGAKI